MTYITPAQEKRATIARREYLRRLANIEKRIQHTIDPHCKFKGQQDLDRIISIHKLLTAWHGLSSIKPLTKLNADMQAQHDQALADTEAVLSQWLPVYCPTIHKDINSADPSGYTIAILGKDYRETPLYRTVVQIFSDQDLVLTSDYEPLQPGVTYYAQYSMVLVRASIDRATGKPIG